MGARGGSQESRTHLSLLVSRCYHRIRLNARRRVSIGDNTMRIRWARKISIQDLIGPGGKCGELIPDVIGIYRVRAMRDKKNVSRGSVIYIGKVGGGTREDRHLRRRVGEFIIAGMGFGLPHSGGIRFWDEGGRHKFWIQDLCIEYFPTDDPICAEIRAFEEFEQETGISKPLLNKKIPRQSCRLHRHQ